MGAVKTPPGAHSEPNALRESGLGIGKGLLLGGGGCCSFGFLFEKSQSILHSKLETLPMYLRNLFAFCKAPILRAQNRDFSCLCLQGHRECFCGQFVGRAAYPDLLKETGQGSMLPKHGRLRQLLALVLASRIFWDWRHGRQASVTTTICKDKDGGCDQVGVDDAKGL